MISFKYNAVAIFIMICSSVANCQVSLDNAVVTETHIEGSRDAVYDRSRNLIYASISSSIGFPNGNSLAFIDPETMSILKYVHIGSEPYKLKLSSDSSLVYVSLSGAYSFRRYNLISGEVGDLQALFEPDPSQAEDLAIYPNNSEIVIVSLNSVSSSGNGHLNVYDIEGQMPIDSIRQSNSLAFVDQTTLITYNSNRIRRLIFNGVDLIEEQSASGLFSGWSTRIEAAAGLIYSTTGAVLEPSTLTLLGTFAGANGAVEPVPSLGITYFMDSSTLKVFDNKSFEELDRIELTEPSNSPRELFAAGTNRLGYFRSNGVIGIIEGIPVPAPCRVDLTGDGDIDYFDVFAFITAMVNQDSVADFNYDGQWDFHDVSAFLQSFAVGCQ